jgi:hypothetical protein
LPVAIAVTHVPACKHRGLSVGLFWKKTIWAFTSIKNSLIEYFLLRSKNTSSKNTIWRYYSIWLITKVSTTIGIIFD